MESGADLTQPRHVLHYLYFPSEDAAQRAAETAGTQSWQCTVKEPLPNHPGHWCVLCEKLDAVTDADTVRDDGDFFDVVAARYQGEYDGWEASV